MKQAMIKTNVKNVYDIDNKKSSNYAIGIIKIFFSYSTVEVIKASKL